MFNHGCPTFWWLKANFEKETLNNFFIEKLSLYITYKVLKVIRIL